MLRLISKIIIWCIALFIGTSVLAVVIYKYMPVYITPTMVIKSIEQGNGWQHQWTPLEEISENMSLAVIASEDNLFMSHNGFDFQQIKIAAEEAKKLQLYSDPQCRDLHAIFEDVFGFGKDEVLFTNGSDEILNFAFMAFCDENHSIFYISTKKSSTHCVED